MGKKMLTADEMLKKWKRRFFILLSIFAVFLALAGFYTYLNYDYLVFKHFISQHYIYTNTLDQLYKKQLKRDVKGKYYTYFDDLVISSVTEKIREINNDKYTYLYIPEQYERYKQEEKAEADRSEVKALNGNTVYLRLTNFSKYTKDFVAKNLKTLEKYPNIIIDLRDNRGGDVDAMNKIADLFLPRGNVITTDKLRLLDWVSKARKKQVLKYRKIAILQNKDSASASECLIGALKDNLDNVVLIGEPTFGKGIGQYTIDLKKGFAVKATVMLWYTPKGYNIHGKGFAPDIPYQGDDIVDFALAELMK
ncbi:MAG: S41 family peptidase [Clostridia bacterium]|nr:S41 family peptidase [Clostridia bacterium]